MRPATLRRVAALAAVAATTSLAQPAPAAARVPCQQVLPSPAFARDRTAVCLYRDNGTTPEMLGVSTDGGRSWHKAPMTGLTRPEGVNGINLTVLFSPAYATDHTLLAVTRSGLFASTDRAETFALVDPLVLGGGPGNPVAYLADATLAAPPALPGGRHLFALYAAGYRSARIDVTGHWHEPVPGAPGGATVRFAVGGATPLAFTSDVDQVTGQVVVAVYRCTAALACTDRLFTFPAGTRLAESIPIRRLRDGSLLVTVGDEARDEHVWRSTDGGATFAPWRSVEAVLAPVNRAGDSAPALSLVPDPGRAHRLFLRVAGTSLHGNWLRNGPPAEQLFRSDDDGRTWQRIGYQRAIAQPGPRGNLPWNERADGDGAADVVPAGDGRTVFATATYISPGEATDNYVGAFCSHDGGLHWKRAC